jgi:hypothetical protein
MARMGELREVERGMAASSEVERTGSVVGN